MDLYGYTHTQPVRTYRPQIETKIKNPHQISQNSKSIEYDPITHEISSESTQ